jgi:hypothetical protein
MAPSSWAQDELVGAVVQVVSVQVIIALATWAGVGEWPPQLRVGARMDEARTRMGKKLSSLFMTFSLEG